MNNPPPSADAQPAFSHGRTVARFDSQAVAAKYPAVYSDSFRQQREKNCVIKALQHVPPGGSILDLPCGTGRLMPLFVAAGFRVTSADSSPHMVQLARQNYAQLQESHPDLAEIDVEFSVRDVMATGYADDSFDAVFCNRLFHHFTESETRIRALSELGRICRGPLIVSYFDAFAFDALKRRIRYALKGRKPDDRVAIPQRKFAADLNAAGLEIVTTLSVLKGLSPMRYVIAQNRDAETLPAAA